MHKRSTLKETMNMFPCADFSQFCNDFYVNIFNPALFIFENRTHEVAFFNFSHLSYCTIKTCITPPQHSYNVQCLYLGTWSQHSLCEPCVGFSVGEPDVLEEGRGQGGWMKSLEVPPGVRVIILPGVKLCDSRLSTTGDNPARLSGEHPLTSCPPVTAVYLHWRQC